MYKTLIDTVKGDIEEKTLKNNSIFIKGWSFSEKFGVCPVRCRYDGTIKSVEICTRSDICEKFNKNSLILSGWSFEVPENKFCDIQIKYDKDWHTILSFNTNCEQVVKDIEKVNYENLVSNRVINIDNIDSLISSAINDFKQKYPTKDVINPNIETLNLGISENIIPNLIIVDNFYQNPDNVRKIIMDNPPNYITHTNYIKNKIENIMNCKISSFDKYKTENNTNLAVSSDPILITTSENQYSAVIFLTPNAPINSGITLYRSKHTKTMTVSDSDKSTVFQNGNQDITEFEPVDIIANVYNRLVIFNTQLIHGNSHNFGTNNNNARLTQTLSFDIQK